MKALAYSLHLQSVVHIRNHHAAAYAASCQQSLRMLDSFNHQI